jgi:peptidoglycan LD-endopeptidase CwlK
MSYKLSKRSLSRLEGIDDKLLQIVKSAIKDSPYDFGIPQHGGLRTPEDQYGLFLRKVSQLDGYKKKSYHQTGKAFDIYGYVDGKATWNKDILGAIAEHILKVAKELFGVKLTWGGDWDGDGVPVYEDPDERFFDGAHFQMD